MVEDYTSSHHPERQLGLPTEKVAIFGDKDFCADPLGIASNERIGGFEPSELVLAAQLKRHDGVLIDLSQEFHDSKELPRGFRREVTEDFVNDRAGNVHTVLWRDVNQKLQQGPGSSLGRGTEGKDEFVGVNDEAQLCLATVLRARLGCV